jgi:hypothetical protein
MFSDPFLPFSPPRLATRAGGRAAPCTVDKIFTDLAFMIAPACNRPGKAHMNDDRYSMKIGNIGQQEIDLLECLLRIDLGQALDARAADMCRRLIEAGLVQDSDDGLVLTPAGIERCRSLKHRVAGDKEAARVIADRGIGLASASLHGQWSAW